MLEVSPLWKPSAENLSIEDNIIDVWLCDLQALSRNTQELYNLLSEDEVERADKLKVEDKKQQYIITRACLRHHLSQVTNLKAQDFIFDYLEHGKPVMSSGQEYSDITFNVSHSHNLALIAISKKLQLGIDIEKINTETNHQQLISRFFSETEQKEFATMADELKPKAFCAGWTRKEAFIKAIGNGITYGLNNFDVSIDPANQQPSLNLHQETTNQFEAINLPINDDYMACLVADNSIANIRTWQQTTYPI